MKKVLYLRTDISDKELQAGGSVAHTLGVVKGYIDLGYNVVCASSVMQEQLKQCKVTEFLNLRMPGILSFLRWRVNCLLSNLIFFAQILPLLKKHKNIDVMYQRYGIFNCVGVMLSRLKKIPLILEYNGSEVWVDKNWSVHTSLRFSWLIAKIEEINLRHAQSIVVVSQVLHDELVSRGISAHKILVNPNGVDTVQFDPARLTDMRILIRQQLALQDRFVFCFVGTFSQWHGVDILANMVPAVIQHNPKAHFLFVGDGPLLPLLKNEIFKASLASAVTFTGLVPQAETKNYLAAADAFACPTQPNPDGSRFFGSPTKLFEYMSMGKPIIASDLEQLADVIYPAVRIDQLHDELWEPDAVGILIQPHNVDGFIEAACSLMRRPIQAHTMGMRARAKAVAECQWKSHVQKLAEFRSVDGLPKTTF